MRFRKRCCWLGLACGNRAACLRTWRHNGSSCTCAADAASCNGTDVIAAAGLGGATLRLKVRKQAARFPQASPSQQHRLRKRIKRLRYVLEGAQSLFKRRVTRSCLRGLRQALQALGELHDLQIAQAHYRERAAQDPQAWFAVGYLAGREPELHRAAVQALAKLKSNPPQWRQAG